MTGGGRIRAAQAVRSGDHAEVWFVAADLEGPGKPTRDVLARFGAVCVSRAALARRLAQRGWQRDADRQPHAADDP